MGGKAPVRVLCVISAALVVNFIFYLFTFLNDWPDVRSGPVLIRSKEVNCSTRLGRFRTPFWTEPACGEVVYGISFTAGWEQ